MHIEALEEAVVLSQRASLVVVGDCVSGCLLLRKPAHIRIDSTCPSHTFLQPQSLSCGGLGRPRNVNLLTLFIPVCGGISGEAVCCCVQS